MSLSATATSLAGKLRKSPLMNRTELGWARRAESAVIAPNLGGLSHGLTPEPHSENPDANGTMLVDLKSACYAIPCCCQPRLGHRLPDLTFDLNIRFEHSRIGPRHQESDPSYYDHDANFFYR